MRFASRWVAAVACLLGATFFVSSLSVQPDCGHASVLDLDPDGSADYPAPEDTATLPMAAAADPAALTPEAPKAATRNLVMGIAIAMSAEAMYPFVRTLRTHSDADLVMFVGEVSSPAL